MYTNILYTQSGVAITATPLHLINTAFRLSYLTKTYARMPKSATKVASMAKMHK